MWKRSKGQTKEKITPSSKRSSIANIVVSEHAAPCRPGTHTLLCWIFLAHNGGFWLTHSCFGLDLHFTVDLIWEQSPNHRSKSNSIIEILPVCLGYCLLYPTRKLAHMIPCMWKWIWNFFLQIIRCLDTYGATVFDVQRRQKETLAWAKVNSPNRRTTRNADEPNISQICLIFFFSWSLDRRLASQTRATRNKQKL